MFSIVRKKTKLPSLPLPIVVDDPGTGGIEHDSCPIAKPAADSQWIDSGHKRAGHYGTGFFHLGSGGVLCTVPTVLTRVRLK
jgi:hypothetical protein